ncbi:L-threonylcarbamoyladenylate synthase [Anaplasma phagocytophilum]|uniref:L-threonylcarbamoyladenylate synthase n=1 Tax=Anaplasma phagocytophilum TaxID=948 RepID=UPI002010B396|nr:L-threonylcarbamoyladenylate synthase [Anaplasma phagocytophilum]UQD54598.1 threonylcarbamoyl-AMP synthase [Anaplasma phagocytophilum]
MVEEIVNALRNEEIVCFPTETLYALACSAFSERAVAKLYDIKRRLHDKPFSLMLGDIQQVKKFSNMKNTDLRIMEMLSPGPITFILPLHYAQNLPRRFFKDTLGVRIPDHALACNILSRFEFPVVATSANLSGERDALKASDIPEELRMHVSKLWEDDSSVSGMCSTVFDMVSQKILRTGMLPSSKILDAINRGKTTWTQ